MRMKYASVLAQRANCKFRFQEPFQTEILIWPTCDIGVRAESFVSHLLLQLTVVSCRGLSSDHRNVDSKKNSQTIFIQDGIVLDICFFIFPPKLHIIFLTSSKLGKTIIARTANSLYFSVYMVERLTLSRLFSFPRTANITCWWSAGSSWRSEVVSYLEIFQNYFFKDNISCLYGHRSLSSFISMASQ